MQQPVRYYIHTRGEQPSMRTVPVAHRQPSDQPSDQPRAIREQQAAASPERERPEERTAVGRLRLALKRSIR